MRVAYIGDNTAASGFSLIGVRASTPEPEEHAVWSALQRARKDNDLVIINARHAACIRERLSRLLSESPVPPVLELPAMQDNEAMRWHAMDDARRVLGLVADGNGNGAADGG
jgi:vacuolar-type H+-ATPase subunit F/Vma7